LVAVALLTVLQPRRAGTFTPKLSPACARIPNVTPQPAPGGSDPAIRDRLAKTVEAIEAWDDSERQHVATTAAWIASGAPLYRTRKPDVPATHLVSYFVVVNERRGELLLVAHRAAGLWLPPGGHVEPGEDPWRTVVRECHEELGIEAVPSAVAGDRPFFLTATQTRGPGQHTDVSLWYVLKGNRGEVVGHDEREFAGIRWLTPAAVLAEPADGLDPHLHRFTDKLLAAPA